MNIFIYITKLIRLLSNHRWNHLYKQILRYIGLWKSINAFFHLFELYSFWIIFKSFKEPFSFSNDTKTTKLSEEKLIYIHPKMLLNFWKIWPLFFLQRNHFDQRYEKWTKFATIYPRRSGIQGYVTRIVI